MTSQTAASQGERDLLNAISSMLTDRGYLFPLAAAQRQFRDAYYGMSAAALLEDLFFDAFNNYLHQDKPGSVLERPGRGQKGWDYRFDGTEVSHKVGLGPTQVAALWDATRTDLTHWSFTSTVLFISTGYSPKKVILDGGPLDNLVLQPVSGKPDEVVRPGMSLLALHWSPEGSARLLGKWTAETATAITSLASFRDVWVTISAAIQQGAATNEIELLLAPAKWARPLTWVLADETARFLVHPSSLRSGIYLLPQSSLQDVPVGTNNRGVLVATGTVSSLMRASAEAGLFAPLPTWFAAWAPDKPPNLYLTQRGQFDELFSNK